MRDHPADGDVLITAERGLHYLSIVPHPHRLSFQRLPHAIDIAKRWCTATRVEIWVKRDGAGPVRFPAQERPASTKDV
jgi:hypothetical protein